MQGNEFGHVGAKHIVENPQTSLGSTNSSFQLKVEPTTQTKVPYFLAGIFFGILMVKSEVISWFRIQEMFRLQSFHMYGIIGSAVLVGMISVYAIKKFDIKTIHKEQIKIIPKPFSKGQVYGGLLFGFGWAITGACPGPIFAQIGTGATVIIVTLLSALAGTWTYGLIRNRLPH